MQGGDLPAVNGIDQRLRIFVRLRHGHHQPGAHTRRPEKFPHRHIKAARRFLQYHIRCRQRVLVLHPLQPVNDGGMADQYAFRLSCGARGINQIRRMRRSDIHPLKLRRVAGLQVVHIQQRAVASQRLQPCKQGFCRDQRRRASIL